MIFYIASYPRSGNIWLRSIIAKQFRKMSTTIYGERRTGESLEQWIHWAQQAYGLDISLDIKNNNSLPDLPKYWFAEYAANESGNQKNVTLVPGFETEFSEDVRKELAAHDEYFFIKTHSPPYDRYFPGEHVIQIYRHPGASLWSYYLFLNEVQHAPISLEHILTGEGSFGSWSEYHIAWQRTGRKLGSRYLSVAYESLFENEQAFVQLLSEFMELPIRSTDPVSFIDLTRFGPGLARLGDPTEWHAHFEDSQLQLLYEKHGKIMAELGYQEPEAPDTPPAVFHITHPKAGSQWIAQVLRECAPPGRIVEPQVKATQFFDEPLQPGGVYPALYLGRRQFEAVKQFNFFAPLHYAVFMRYLGRKRIPMLAENWKNFGLKRYPHREFVVIRDLRDTFVSLYFSLKNSHPLQTDEMAVHRDHLQRVGLNEGLIYVMSHFGHFQYIQTRWLGHADLLVRYEDLVADEFGTFSKIFAHCQIKVEPEQLKDILARNSFEVRTGRKRGQTDMDHHLRSGVIGDWQRYFSDEVKQLFKEKFGDVLIKTGYEKDLNW